MIIFRSSYPRTGQVILRVTRECRFGEARPRRDQLTVIVSTTRATSSQISRTSFNQARLVHTSRAIPANTLLALEENTAQTLRIIHFWNRRLWGKVYKRLKRNKKPKLRFRVYSRQLTKAYWMMMKAYSRWRHGWVRGYTDIPTDTNRDALGSSKIKADFSAPKSR